MEAIPPVIVAAEFFVVTAVAGPTICWNITAIAVALVVCKALNAPGLNTAAGTSFARYPLPADVSVKLLTSLVGALKLTVAFAGEPTYVKLPTVPEVCVGGVVPGAVVRLATYKLSP